ncbi:hypothetical protein BH10BAC3_BH10BAC3_28290 [soil metagenome]
MVALIACGGVFLLAGCYKDKTVFILDDITTPVSFSKDIVPIFNNSCNIKGCHNTGGQVPDLTPTNAYQSLFEEDMIDTADPENSEVMGWLTGEIKPAMPLGGSTNPSNINALMLAWIKQGAKNN